MITPKLENEELYNKIKLISNKTRFKILELTYKEKTITELSKLLGLNYSKTIYYVSLLEKEKFLIKRKKGKEVFVKYLISLKLLNKILKSNN